MASSLITAFLGGLLPVLVWLYFLEHEDKNPEPKKLILIAFLAGMTGVILTIPLEAAVAWMVQGMGIRLFFWAIIEEAVKFFVAYIVVLRRAENDEPIDSIMYMIAVALGFAALENALFILHPILLGDTTQAFVTANFRFIGATLLHVIASSAIGASLALAFYKPSNVKRNYLLWGFILAITLHTVFNLSIISNVGTRAIISFYGVWLAVIGIFLVIEKIKSIQKPFSTK